VKRDGSLTMRRLWVGFEAWRGWLAEQYALKQKRGFVVERLYIVHFGDDGK
jgi:hypothetical protein